MGPLRGIMARKGQWRKQDSNLRSPGLQPGTLPRLSYFSSEPLAYRPCTPWPDSGGFRMSHCPVGRPLCPYELGAEPLKRIRVPTIRGRLIPGEGPSRIRTCDIPNCGRVRSARLCHRSTVATPGVAGAMIDTPD